MPIRRSGRPLWPRTAITVISAFPAGGRELAIAVGSAVLVVVIVCYRRGRTTVCPLRGRLHRALPQRNRRDRTARRRRLGRWAPLRTWFTDAKPSIAAMFIAADNFVAAARYGGIAEAGTTCRIAADALATLQHHTPSPEPALNTELQQANTSYETGNRHCIAGKRDRDPVETGKAIGDFSQGSTELPAAVGIDRRRSGR